MKHDTQVHIPAGRPYKCHRGCREWFVKTAGAMVLHYRLMHGVEMTLKGVFVG
jgi:hypothetical protein